MALALLLSACANQPTAIAGDLISEAPIRTLPGLALQPADTLSAIDLATAGRALHVAFSVTTDGDDAAVPASVIEYSRSPGPEGEFTPPERVATSSAPLRLALARGRLHLVHGPLMRHALRFDADEGWRIGADPLLRTGGDRVVYDLATYRDAAHLAYLIQPVPPYEPGERAPQHDRRLYLTRLDEDGSYGAPREIARFPPSTYRSPPPALIVEAGRLHLLLGLCDENRVPAQGGSATAVGIVGRIVHWTSDDGGETWTPPDVINPGRRISDIDSVSLAATPRGLIGFFSARGVFASRLVDNGAWSAPVRIDGSGLRDLESGSLAASTLRVAWIDSRNRRTDARWWNPLGGVPWSDDTLLWANNDVFTMTTAAVMDRLERGIVIPPIRLTPDLSFAGQVRVATSGDDDVVLWSGRSRVGKRPADAGQPPQLFFVSLPAETSSRQRSPSSPKQ